MNDELVVVLCTAPDDGETPSRLARMLVDARLAACVNLLPGLLSHYRWEGELHAEREVQLLIKTRRTLFERLEAWLHENHPYDVPELIALPAALVGEGYLRWSLAQTEAEGDSPAR